MKKSKTLELIIPPNPYLADEMRDLPLGILYLNAVAEKKDYPVKITDLRTKSIETFPQFIGESDVYGITATTPDYFLAKKIAEIAKSKNPESWTVLGGIHATAVSPYKIDKIFDKVVVGEGEISLLKILEDYKKDGERIYNGGFIKNINTIPFPARHALPFASVFTESVFFEGGPSTSIITSRGCPYNCSFCASGTMWNRKVRFRDSNNVVSEINEVINKYGVKNFRFMDDTMTLNKKRLEELCTQFKNLGIKWRIETRVDQVSPESLKTLKESGCIGIAYGIESPTQEVLDAIHKNISLDVAKKAIKMTNDVGLNTSLFFIIGLPKETPGYTERFIKFVEETKPYAVVISTFVPYPGCDIYNNPKKYGIKLKTENFSVYHMALGLLKDETDRDFTYKHDIMTNQQLKNERTQVLQYVKSKKMSKNLGKIKDDKIDEKNIL